MPDAGASSPPATDAPPAKKPGCLMRLIKAVFCLALILIALFLGIAAVLPDSFEIQRSIVIDAPAEEIYPYVADFREWPNWSTWNTDHYPELTFEYSGAEIGQGAIETWQEPSMGGGRMEILSADKHHGVAYDLKFEEFETEWLGDIAFEPTENGRTRVVWRGQGELQWPAMRWMGLMFDAMIGADYETGLAGLKELVEGTE